MEKEDNREVGILAERCVCNEITYYIQGTAFDGGNIETKF